MGSKTAAEIISSTKDLPEVLLSEAKAAGAQFVEVYQSSTLSRPIIFEGNRLKQIETSQSEGVALRLWRDGRPGLAVGYGPIDAKTLVEKALAISTLNLPETADLATGGSDPAPDTAEANCQAFPEKGQAMAVEKLVDLGRGAIAQIRTSIPEAVCEAEFSCDVEYIRLINSTGLDYSFQDTTLSGYISAELIQQDDFLCVNDGTLSRHQLDIGAVADSIVQRLVWAQQTVEPTIGQVPIIFTPGAAWLLWDTLRSALNGKRVKEGISPWRKKLGKRVIDSAVTLRQDPTVGPYICPFDDEGVLTQPLTLVENGVVKSWYCDRAHGTTGNGIRPELGDYPTPGLINLLVTPGKQDLQTLIAQQKDAIIIDQVMGEGGDITGDLAVNLDLGYQVKNGEIIGRVKDTMVSGNAYTALNNLIALGSDIGWSGSTYTPSVVVEGLSVIG